MVRTEKETLFEIGFSVSGGMVIGILVWLSEMTLRHPNSHIAGAYAAVLGAVLFYLLRIAIGILIDIRFPKKYQ